MITKAGADTYRNAIRNYVRGLWSGAIDRDQFEQGMIVAIGDGLADAFARGAKECGIEPDDYTDVEQRAINDAVDREVEALDGFMQSIVDGSKANGGQLDPLFSRADMWILRYNDVMGRARVMACGDQKFKWVLGPTEHCSTCAKLAGLVHRGSQWRDYVLPQNPPNDQLECGGWNCQCSLEPTTERASRRYPPVP